MADFKRRDFLKGAAIAAGSASALTESTASSAPQQGEAGEGASLPMAPIREEEGATIIGPSNPVREKQSGNRLRPPKTDSGTVPGSRWTFADSHNRLKKGGWARQTTVRELPVARELACVNMRLKAGAIREMHWHRPAEWAFMIKGSARITAVDPGGRTFQDDVRAGDLWNFPTGIPHSIQGLGDDGCEFLLVFDDGNFKEDETFLLTDWLAHTPKSVLAKNFDVPESAFAQIPKKELYIFPARVPGPLANDRVVGAGPVPQTYSHRLLAQEPIRTKGGTVRIADSGNFSAATTIAAAFVEVEPGAMREMHWHPNADEMQYYLSGQARMTVFISGGNAGTFDFQAGDVGYVQRSMGHYIENTGTTKLQFLELWKTDKFSDVSLRQWLAFTPFNLVQAHLKIAPEVLSKIPINKTPIVPH